MRLMIMDDFTANLSMINFLTEGIRMNELADEYSHFVLTISMNKIELIHLSKFTVECY